jgi:hypothetical protein
VPACSARSSITRASCGLVRNSTGSGTRAARHRTGSSVRRRLPQGYEISVRGHLGETILQAFPALQAERRGQDTLLRGALPDQAALHGVLAQIETLGLELLEVRRLPPS